MDELPIIKCSNPWYYDLDYEDKHGIYITGDGTFYWVNGEQHRIDGPAEEWNTGDKYWYCNGMLHRLDGPACEWNDGSKFWWINDKELKTQEEYEVAVYLYKNGLESYE